MVSAGLTALSCCSFDVPRAVSEHNTMKILCIGHGGGSIPLFLASKFKGMLPLASLIFITPYTLLLDSCTVQTELNLLPSGLCWVVRNDTPGLSN
jgi:hypothetical protein